METRARLTGRTITVLIAGAIAAVIGYVLTVTNWGADWGTIGWLLLIAGLSLIAAVGLTWFWQVSGGIDLEKLRNRKGPRDPANEQRRQGGDGARI